MKLIRAARFAGVVFLVALLYVYFLLAAGLDGAHIWASRQLWLDDNSILWQGGGWLVLLAIFAWMVLLVAFMYSYSPAHRITSMLQSGLLIIGAVLLIGGVVVWMNLLPQAADAQWAAFVDRLAMTLSGAGLLMGGAVTAWIAIDGMLLDVLPRPLLIPGALAGLLFVPAPFVLPNATLILFATVLLVVWAALLGMRRSLPPAYDEMPAGFGLR